MTTSRTLLRVSTLPSCSTPRMSTSFDLLRVYKQRWQFLQSCTWSAKLFLPEVLTNNLDGLFCTVFLSSHLHTIFLNIGSFAACWNVYEIFCIFVKKIQNCGCRTPKTAKIWPDGRKFQQKYLSENISETVTLNWPEQFKGNVIAKIMTSLEKSDQICYLLLTMTSKFWP